MVGVERRAETKELSSWVVVSNDRKSDIIFDLFVNTSLGLMEDENIDEMPLAYDVRADLDRYEDLKNDYGEEKAALMLREEMRSDMKSHFAELGSENNRIKLFEYEYVILEDGQLRESEGGKDLVSKMFVGQENEILGDLWLSHIIPFLEDARVGQSAFTLSVKSNSIFEGLYDFGYFFIKTSENTVKCTGVELDLSRVEQREIINEQLRSQRAPEQAMLKSEFDWREARGRVIFYEEDEHISFEEMFLSILGRKVSLLRGNYELGDEKKLEIFVKDQRNRMEGVVEEADEVVENMLLKISMQRSIREIDEDLKIGQMNYLMKNDPELLWEARERGYVILACGIINIDKGLDVGNEKSWNYHNGTCKCCGCCNVEVGPCEICKKCEEKFDKDQNM